MCVCVCACAHEREKGEEEDRSCVSFSAASALLADHVFMSDPAPAGWL